MNEVLIQELIKNKVETLADLAQIRRKVLKKYKIPFPNNIELLKVYHDLLKNKRVKKSEKIETLLKTRPIRSLSGIINISVLTKPYPCPGKCVYCPQEKGIPKSYLSGEPAVERAKRLNFHPYLQVKKRIEMLKSQGHATDKIELRIVGGTWSYYPKKYQNWFIKTCFNACNKIQSSYLCIAQKLNERARHRIVGLSVETRPDFINISEIKRLRELGVTMVELGVQSIYDDILKINVRGHGVKEIVTATKLLKDAGFKVLYQIMPNLPGSNLKRDKKMFEELFSNPNFQPDFLKIYPCALVKEAPLYQWWKEKKYQPYTKKQLINFIKTIKREIPYYVRIQRIVRDIPSQKIISGGARTSNLRQLIAKDIKEEGWKCKCIRCREVRENYNPKEKVFMFRQDYQASKGKEIFLSLENKDRTKLYSLLRLRILPLKGHFLSVLKNGAIIREIHTFGEVASIGKIKIAPQHKGLGKKLIKEAEKIAKQEFGLKKIVIISAIGARDYFRKLGYKLKDTYMIKSLRSLSI